MVALWLVHWTLDCQWYRFMSCVREQVENMKWRNAITGKSPCLKVLCACKGLPIQLFRASHCRVSDIQASWRAIKSNLKLIILPCGVLNTLPLGKDIVLHSWERHLNCTVPLWSTQLAAGLSKVAGCLQKSTSTSWSQLATPGKVCFVFNFIPLLKMFVTTLLRGTNGFQGKHNKIWGG